MIEAPVKELKKDKEMKSPQKQKSKIGETLKNMSDVSTYNRSNSNTSFLKALKYIKWF